MIRHHLRLFGIVVLAPFWYLFSCAVPKRSDFIAINAFPDFDDTVYSLFNGVSSTGLKLIVLTIKKGALPPAWLASGDVIIAHRYSLRGLWLYHRSKYVFFTHGLFSFWSTTRRQVVVNLWHGMPIKNIGFLDGKSWCEVPRFDYTIAYNEKFTDIIARAFGVPVDKVLISAHPRMEGMARWGGVNRLGLPAYKFLSLWLPTYRAAKVGDVRMDGDIVGDIFNEASDLSVLDEFFGRNDSVCIIKPHPMARANRDLFLKYSNIIFVDDGQLASLGITLYQLLGLSNFLITDISSVYFDYKYTGRPAVVYCPDFMAYMNSRGFVSAIDNLIDEQIIVDLPGLVVKLQKIFDDMVLSEIILPLDITIPLLSMVGAISMGPSTVKLNDLC